MSNQNALCFCSANRILKKMSHITIKVTEAAA